MKNTLTKRVHGAILTAGLLLGCAASSNAAGQPDLNYNVILNVASIIGDSNGPFSLDLQLAPGSDNVTNTITLSNFTFLGGSASSTPNFTMGGESGSLATTLTLTNSNNIDNEFAEAFSAGVTQISFHVDQTVNPETGVNAINDQFNVSIDDNSGFPFATTDPSGNNQLVSSEIIEGESLSDVKFYSSTSPNPGVTAVPEPKSSAMLLIGALGLFAWKRRSMALKNE
jgi:hypothetical protein